MVLGKLAGNTLGRLFHFIGVNLKGAIKAQVLSGFVQSSTLAIILVLVWLYTLQLAYTSSLLFAVIIVMSVSFCLIKAKLKQIFLYSILRYAAILLSYAIAINQYANLAEFALAILKTFSILVFVPFSPLATLGSKEFLMQYFFSNISLEQYIYAGTLVFLFNNLLPGLIGMVLTVIKKWK